MELEGERRKSVNVFFLSFFFKISCWVQVFEDLKEIQGNGRMESSRWSAASLQQPPSQVLKLTTPPICTHY